MMMDAIVRMMVRFLERRGWIVFFVGLEHRTCNSSIAWLEFYEYKKGLPGG